MVNFKKVMLAAGGADAAYFITAWQGSNGNNARANSCRVLPNGKIAFSGDIQNDVPLEGVIGLIDPATGSLTAITRTQPPAAATGGDCFWARIDVDSSGNIYASGSIRNQNALMTAKYNSDLQVQWRFNQVHTPFQDYNRSGYDDAFVQRSCAVLAGSNFVCATKYQNTGLNGCHFGFTASNGTGSWKQQTGTEIYWTSDMAYDGSQYHYLAGYSSYGAPQVTRFNGATVSGFSWRYSAPSSVCYHNVIAYKANYHSTADLCLASGIQGTGFGLYALDGSNGSVVSGRTVSCSIGQNSNHVPSGVIIDSSGNQYIVGWVSQYAGGTSLFPGFIVKINSSLGIEWVLHLENNNVTNEVPNARINDVTLDENENIVVCGSCSDNFGQTSGYNPNGFLMVLPPDGSITGTYSNGWSIVAKTSSYSIASSSFTTAYQSPYQAISSYTGSNYSGTTGDSTTMPSNEVNIIL